jgi:hypothetical protein
MAVLILQRCAIIGRWGDISMDRILLRGPLTVAALLLATLALACSGDGEKTPADGISADLPVADLSVEEVYARFAEAITRPGHVYHAEVEISQDAGPFSYDSTVEFWVDAERDLARQESQVTFGEGDTRRSHVIIAGGARYTSAQEGQPASKHEASTCHGANASIASVIGCPGPTEESTKTVETGRYEDKAAIVVVTTGTSYGSDETFTFTHRLYLDSETLLPIAYQSEGTADYGEVYPTHSLSHFRNDFLPVNTLPQDFFDPASTGYVERDPEEPLRTQEPGITVYWLGRHYAGSDGLPPLSLAIAYVPEGRLPAPYYRAVLDYRVTDEEFGPPALELQEWDAAEWDAFLAQSGGGNWWNRPCVDGKETILPNGRATIFMSFNDLSGAALNGEVVCPDRPHDRFTAHAYIGSTVVAVKPLTSSSGEDRNPYDSLPGIEAVVRALQPRE